MLTALHQNHNSNRDVKRNIDGSERITIKRKKATNLTPTAYWVKEDADYGEFVMTLLQKEKQVFVVCLIF